MGMKIKVEWAIKSSSNVPRRPPPDMIISLHSPPDMLKILQFLMDAPAGFRMYRRTI